MELPFLGGAYQGRSTNVSSQECINLYFEPAAKHEINKGALVATDGALNWTSSTDAQATPTLGDDNLNPVRGAIVFDDSDPNNLIGGPSRRLFFVIKNIFYEWTMSATTSFLSQVGSDLRGSTGRVSIATNNVGQLIMVDGASGYVLEGNTLTEITDTEFIPTDMVVHQDGYFITTEPGTNRFRYCDLHNGLSWNGLSFQSAEGASDTVESLLSDRRELWVFGDRTTEVYYNAGDLDIPFQRFQNGYLETGIAAKFTAQKFDNSVAWLSKNDRGEAQVVRAGDSFQPVVISSPEVNYQIQQYDVISDAFAYTYQSEGHEFYVITFPSANATWAYDALTQEWHQRANIVDGKFPGRERFSSHVFYQGKHLMGDYQNGRIYALDSATGFIEQDGVGTVTQVPRVRTTPGAFTMNEMRVRCSEFQLDMEEGVNGADVWLSYSKDGGHTFSNEIPRALGPKGKYDARIIWRKMGTGRHWIFRIRTWSTGKIIIKGAYARVYGETSTGE